MKGETVESVLYSLNDVTKADKIEAENQLNRALLRIIQNKDRFRRVLAAIYSCDEKILSRTPGEAPTIQQVRRELHTWKGDIAAFGLHSFAEFIHSIEDELTPEITPARVHEYILLLKNRLMDFVESHHDVLKLSKLYLNEATLSIPDTALHNLWTKISHANSLAHALHTVEEFVIEQTMQKAGDLLSYLSLATLDVSRKLKKPVTVQTSGADVALPHDYRELFDSFIHLVRNAVDHGLEAPGERGKKDPVGKICIEVRSRPDSYQILFSDDGRGVDLARLKTSVLNKNLCTESDWNKMPDEEKVMFIFRSNVSTKDVVTDISGRGIGLDYVYSCVKNAGGNIVVESNPGFGTCFYISLPKLVMKPKILAAV